MKRINFRIILPSVFFIFISSIIFLADTSNQNFAFKLVGYIPYGDKIMHVILYGIMALFLNYGLHFKSYKLFKFNLQLGGILVLTFAVIEEISQYWRASRTFEIADIIADALGIVLFSFLILIKKTKSVYSS